MVLDLQMNGNGIVSEHPTTNGASPAKTNKAGSGKEKSKGFGGFFKLGSGKKENGTVNREGGFSDFFLFSSA